MSYSDFKLIALLGRGTFGKVFLAECTKDKKQYAIKVIRKDVLIEYNQVKNTQLEKDILFSCDHPFLCGMEYLFQSQTRLYFVMPFIRGGELYKVFKARKRLAEPVVAFYAIQIAMAIGYLHGKGIMHRDLKLENVLVDQNGYLKIIDYGLAKALAEGQTSKTFCGTPEYLAPEMVMHQGHDFSVDWWALGILIYEMLIGVTPFYNRERKLLLLKIRQSKVVFPDKKKYKIEYSDEFVDIVLKLLHKEKDQRLGSKDDFREIIAHPFFKDIDKELLLAGKFKPPLVLDVSETGGGFDNKYFNSKSTAQDLAETVLPQANLDKLNKNSN
jgi:serum/glucocorticoid-regulated kinase 2